MNTNCIIIFLFFILFGRDTTAGGGNGFVDKFGQFEDSNSANRISRDTFDERRATGQILRVITAQSEPFVMLKTFETGQDSFEGFCIDLLKEISKILDFNYTIELSPNNVYGRFDPKTGNWNGMIQELIQRKADMAIADLHISFDRNLVVDFSVPWMYSGTSVLMRRPQRNVVNMYTFLKTFSMDVWTCIIISYLVLALLVVLLKRLKSKWLLVTICLVFTVFLVAIYISSVSGWFNTNWYSHNIQAADDLVKQTEVKYGMINQSSTYQFFKRSNDETHRKMFAFMEQQRPSVYANSMHEGITTVRKGNYAFLIDSTYSEYITERQCDLMQIGKPLNTISYGVALVKGSPLREAISGAILKLRESGKIDALKHRWWKEKRGGGSCMKNAGSKIERTHGVELGLQNIGGLFVLLLLATVIVLLIVITECILRAKKVTKEENVSFTIALKQQLRRKDN